MTDLPKNTCIGVFNPFLQKITFWPIFCEFYIFCPNSKNFAFLVQFRNKYHFQPLIWFIYVFGSSFDQITFLTPKFLIFRKFLIFHKFGLKIMIIIKTHFYINITFLILVKPWMFQIFPSFVYLSKMILKQDFCFVFLILSMCNTLVFVI